MKTAFLLLPFLALALSASDLSGKWSGTIDIEDSGSTIPIQVELVQKSDVLSGKVGRTGTGDEGTIRNGKVDGTKVSFEVVSAETSLTGGAVPGAGAGCRRAQPAPPKITSVATTTGSLNCVTLILMNWN